MRGHRRCLGKQKRFCRIAAVLVGAAVLVSCLGCETMARKFRKRPKKEKTPTEEVVYAPEEYQAAAVSGEDRYREALAFWKGWHDEMIDALAGDTNKKRQLGCAQEAITNLREMSRLLEPDKKKRLQELIQELENLKEEISRDIYNINAGLYQSEAQQLRKKILREFAVARVKDSLS